MNARAYVNWSRWVADCPRPFCNAAELLRPRQSTFACAECLLVVPVEWPADAEEIWRALESRPVPATRNWYPRDHELAVRAGLPHGQTVAELIAETREHESEGG